MAKRSSLKVSAVPQRCKPGQRVGLLFIIFYLYIYRRNWTQPWGTSCSWEAWGEETRKETEETAKEENYSSTWSRRHNNDYSYHSRSSPEKDMFKSSLNKTLLRRLKLGFGLSNSMHHVSCRRVLTFHPFSILFQLILFVILLLRVRPLQATCSQVGWP